MLPGCRTLADPRKTLVHILKKAAAEKRLTCGMLPALKLLELDAAGALFCVVPQSRKHDSAFHIQHVLLEAFCYEHDIHMVKVDSTDKLRSLISWVESPRSPKEHADVSCVLVSRGTSAPDQSSSLSEAEKSLQVYCDEAQSVPNPPVIKLPNL
ncbi:uncharacterized protein LOC134540259 isoform X2 [Bacillus rossius redtenbacheri]|uniref:uncharacterized protein LOC134540259 isoform X2 n=1 Tax=Bacillus rossius redtenbacheri TaxID=93214 RepID=UPI002FDE7234